MVSPFFRSKFRVPTVPDHYVARERLIELLDDLADYAVTAIVAPAGAGKTALASDWVRRGRRPSAWLALDESDREPAQFWTALMAALDTLAPGVADRATGLVAGAADLDDVGRALSDDLELVDAEPSVLVLDDVHALDGDPGTQAALASFVEHKPAWLHVLLLSRRRLPLPVGPAARRRHPGRRRVRRAAVPGRRGRGDAEPALPGRTRRDPPERSPCAPAAGRRRSS